jgi:hypothetical protein
MTRGLHVLARLLKPKQRKGNAMLAAIANKPGLTKNRTAAAAIKAAPRMFETLEGRQLMSATAVVAPLMHGTVRTGEQVLTVTGTSSANDLELYRLTNGGVGVYADGKTIGTFNNVAQIVVNSLGGNDRVVIDADVTARSTVHGGEGNDLVRGGGGADMLYGDNGNDTLVGIDGTTSDRVTGGSGRDGFWVDSGESIADADSSEANVGAVHRVGSFMSYNTMVGGNGMHVSPSRELLGQNLPDPVLNDQGGGYANARGMNLFSSAGPSADDVRQTGSVSDCYMMCTMSAIARKNAERLRQTVVDLCDGTFAVRFKNASNQDVFVRVDGDLPLDKQGKPLGANVGNGNNIWTAVIEKAWTIARPGHGSIAGYKNIDFGLLDEGMHAFGVKNILANKFGANPFMSGTDMFNWIAKELQAGKIVTFGTGNVGENNGTPCVGLHAYSVVGFTNSNGQTFLVLRNPWSTDGPMQHGMNDGYIAVSMNEAMYVCAGVSSGNA